MVRPWLRDPVVWLSALFGAVCCAAVVFSGRYLPYQDWAGHVGLSAVLAYGDQTGADAYFVRSLSPTPYYLFYATTAVIGHAVPVEAAAKLNLVFASLIATLGAARLAEAAGRNPRLGVIAPLMLFGVSLGLGFASFVTGLPWLLHALADAEYVFAPDRRRWSAAIRLALFLTLAFLGHGLVFVFAVVLIAVRAVWHVIHRPLDLGAVGWAMLAGIPVTFVALPSVLRRLEHRYVSPEFATPGGPALAGWVPMSTHLQTVAGDLLDRGGTGHTITMGLVVVWALAVAVAVAWRGRHRSVARSAAAQDGLPLYATVMTVVFVFGPAWIGWPVTFWVVYQRAGTVAALLLTMLPRTDLSGRFGTAMAAFAFIPLAHNAVVNRAIVRDYSAKVAPYDEIRTAVPARQRVLGLGGAAASPVTKTLYFYHLVDGAAYVPVGNIPEEVPVHRRNAPGTPFNPNASHFDPRSHGRMYDYVVAHGAALQHRIRAAGTHTITSTQGPWKLYRTRDPLPREAIRW